jgi:hypothetical protein
VQEEDASALFGGGGGGGKKTKSKAGTKSLRESTRERLTAFYTRHNPEKLGNVDATVVKYDGQEEVLWRELNKKYCGSQQECDPWMYGVPGAQEGALAGGGGTRQKPARIRSDSLAAEEEERKRRQQKEEDEAALLFGGAAPASKKRQPSQAQPSQAQDYVEDEDEDEDEYDPFGFVGSKSSSRGPADDAFGSLGGLSSPGGLGLALDGGFNPDKEASKQRRASMRF